MSMERNKITPFVIQKRDTLSGTVSTIHSTLWTTKYSSWTTGGPESNFTKWNARNFSALIFAYLVNSSSLGDIDFCTHRCCCTCRPAWVRT